MIIEIPDNQLCQAFDPLMIFPEKTKYIIKDPMKANTSCLAPAYVYIEGSRGKRFLCDYHYFFEKDVVKWRTPELWKDIAKYLIDNTEKVKETFGLAKTNEIDSSSLCWCTKQAFVKVCPKGSANPIYFCNFHYRKSYYRHVSNNVDFFKLFDVIDERYKITQSINEEAEMLTVI